MKPIFIAESKNAPGISFNADNGLLEITGRSMLENNEDFYRPLIDWIDSYSSMVSNKTVMNFRLKYFNIGSAKYFLEMMKKLEKLHFNKHDVSIFWYHDAADTDLKNAGEDFQVILKLPYHIKQNT